MLALRLILVVVGVALVLTLLGYALSRDRRWLKFLGLEIKAGLALVVILMLIYLVERLVVAI